MLVLSQRKWINTNRNAERREWGVQVIHVCSRPFFLGLELCWWLILARR